MRITTKLISTAAFVAGSWLLAAPAWATCGVNGYWGSECGTQPTTPAGTVLPGDNTNTLTGGNSTATGVGVGVGIGTGGNGYGGAGGSSTATATSTGGQGGAGGQGGGGGSATATGGSVTGSGNSSSDSSAVAGVTANSSKASNLCAMVAIAGPQAALSYLANVDPNVRRALLANGLAEKPSQRKARIAAEAKAGAPAKNARPSQTVRCPAGSAWDGKGCWAPNPRKVRR